VQFKNGTFCTGGLNFRFNTAGTNGSPYNFYLTAPNGGMAVITIGDSNGLVI